MNGKILIVGLIIAAIGIVVSLGVLDSVIPIGDEALSQYPIYKGLNLGFVVAFVGALILGFGAAKDY